MLSLRIQRHLAARCPYRAAQAIVLPVHCQWVSRAASTQSSPKSQAKAAAQRKAEAEKSRKLDSTASNTTGLSAVARPTTNSQSNAQDAEAERLRERTELRKKLIIAVFMGIPILVLLSWHLFKRLKHLPKGRVSEQEEDE